LADYTAVAIFEALHACIHEAVRPQRPVAVAVLIPVARDTHVEVRTAQQVLAIHRAVVFVVAGLRAALSKRVTRLAYAAVVVAPALDTALEVLVANVCLSVAIVIGKATDAEWRRRIRGAERLFVGAATVTEAGEGARPAAGRGAEAPAETARASSPSAARARATGAA